MAENLTELTKNITFAEAEIGNALKSTSTDHVIADAQNIYDTKFGGYQSEINQYLDDKFNDYLLLTGGTISGDLTITGNINGNATSADKATDSDKLGGQPATNYVLKTNIATETEIKALFTPQVNEEN